MILFNIELTNTLDTGVSMLITMCQTGVNYVGNIDTPSSTYIVIPQDYFMNMYIISVS